MNFVLCEQWAQLQLGMSVEEKGGEVMGEKNQPPAEDTATEILVQVYAGARWAGQFCLHCDILCHIHTSGHNRFCVITWCPPSIIPDLAHTDAHLFHPGHAAVEDVKTFGSNSVLSANSQQRELSLQLHSQTNQGVDVRTVGFRVTWFVCDEEATSAVREWSQKQKVHFLKDGFQKLVLKCAVVFREIIMQL